MADAIRFRGFPELRARLDAVASGAWPEIARDWQSRTVDAARAGAPSRTGRGRASIRAAEVRPTRAVVRGAYWLVFIDRGTRAHPIEPKGISGSGRGGRSDSRVLAFEWGGRTVFARRVWRRRVARRPFLSRAAHEAIRPGTMSGDVVRLWNRRGARQRYRAVAPAQP